MLDLTEVKLLIGAGVSYATMVAALIWSWFN